MDQIVSSISVEEFRGCVRPMKLLKKITMLFAVSAIACGLSTGVASANAPEETITLFTDAILEAMDGDNDYDVVERYEVMYEAINETFDLKVLARATINRVYWTTWSSEQQEAYIERLHRYQSAVLADRFNPGNEISFEIDRTVDAPRGTKIVETRIVRGGDEEDIGLDYRLVERSDRWRIVDLYLDSKISEVAMRRSEYSAVVRDQGYDALMEALEAQIIEVLGPDYREEIHGEEPVLDDEDVEAEEAVEDEDGMDGGMDEGTGQ